MSRTKTHTTILPYHHHHILHIQFASWHILTPLQCLLLHHFRIHLYFVTYLFLNLDHRTPYLKSPLTDPQTQVHIFTFQYNFFTYHEIYQADFILFLQKCQIYSYIYFYVFDPINFFVFLKKKVRQTIF